MRSPPSRSRRRIASARLGFAVTAIAGALAFAGCDTTENANVERGRALFQQQCGTCHALAQAGTAANVGPNLDSAFAQARADGMDNDTIEGVVQTQIGAPRAIAQGAQDYARVFMPADLVTGQDAEDVAAYVAGVAGVPGAKPPPLGSPDQVFTEKCSQCHGLVAGTGSGVGPNLGEALAGKDAAFTKQQIVDPNSDIYPGFPSGVMPQDFAQQLPPKDLNALVDYILGKVGRGGSSGAGAAGGG